MVGGLSVVRFQIIIIFSGTPDLNLLPNTIGIFDFGKRNGIRIIYWHKSTKIKARNIVCDLQLATCTYNAAK